MDALQALYDSQVSEDDAVAVLHCSQQCDKSVELDESVFGVVSIATIDVQADQEAPRQIEEIVPAEEREAQREPAEEREAPRKVRRSCWLRRSCSMKSATSAALAAARPVDPTWRTSKSTYPSWTSTTCQLAFTIRIANADWSRKAGRRRPFPACASTSSPH